MPLYIGGNRGSEYELVEQLVSNGYKVFWASKIGKWGMRLHKNLGVKEEFGICGSKTTTFILSVTIQMDTPQENDVKLYRMALPE
ncbi:hypothetical protein [Paenibacillus sp. DMB20]|uniref:hypothetical protein n=1 Tax=Paenibacillus sp. DMB20 TaxID=1642570 RepID=UPI000627E9DC|nr:hypothetical protein [Paenibacillus sp. DMB20]KKO51685.1 hypothetical protein XI25_25070 [Paenibacillus sp. DMB20]